MTGQSLSKSMAAPGVQSRRPASRACLASLQDHAFALCLSSCCFQQPSPARSEWLLQAVQPSHFHILALFIYFLNSCYPSFFFFRNIHFISHQSSLLLRVPFGSKHLIKQLCPFYLCQTILQSIRLPFPSVLHTIYSLLPPLHNLKSSLLSRPALSFTLPSLIFMSALS